MRFNRSPFEGIDQVDIGGKPKDPFLRPKNIRRDLAVDPKKNILSSDPCLYVVSVQALEWVDSKNPTKKGKSFVKAKFKILWTDGDMQVGSEAVYLLDVDNQYFQIEMARLVCNAVNQPPKNFKPSDYEIVIGPTQPLTAMKACVFVRCENTKSSQQFDFTKHWFSPIGVSWNADGSVSSIHQVENKVGEIDKIAA